MVDKRVLAAHGVSAEKWKPLFVSATERRALVRSGAPAVPEAKPRDDSDKSNSLQDTDEVRLDSFLARMWARIRAGRDYNLSSYRVYYGLDLIWDAPFRQLSPSLIATLATKFENTEEVKEVLRTFGFVLDDVIVKTGTRDPKTNAEVMKVNVPAFFSVMVPLVRSYLNIRRAKIVNDRNREPFFQYAPAIRSKANRVRCEALTSRVEQMTQQYNYLEDLNQDVFAMLLYGRGMEFTMEEWDKEEQTLYDNTGKQKDVVTRCGLRYTHPHPTRQYWDMAHPIKSLNTDTGSTFVGFWRVIRYGELLDMAGVDEEGWYNVDKVIIGQTDWWTSGPASWFWKTVYPCTIKVPTPSVPDGIDDRESYLSAHPYYTPDLRDASVLIVEHREKIIPKMCGLGDYDKPVWARFVVAGDGTVIYAAPMCYRPVTVYKDNGDEKRREDASLALQLAPFQDQMSNLLTQYLLAVKQNLVNLTMIDSNIVDQNTIKALRNLGETWYRGLNLFDYDAKKQIRMGNNPANAILTHRFPQMDTNSIMMAMKTVIDLAERVLQFSSLEVAQAATHQQTKAEVDQLSNTTTNLLKYTGLPVDQAMSAKARQIYEAVVNYDEDEVWAQIPSDHAMTKEQLSAIGIELQGDTEEGEQRTHVKVKKSAFNLLSFARTPPSDDRETDIEAATAMATFVRDLMQNPITAQGIGAKQAIDLANQIAKLAGIRLDLPLSDKTQENQAMMQEQIQQQAQQMLKMVADQVLKQAQEQTMQIVKEGLVPVLGEIKSVAQKVQMLYAASGLNATAPPQIGPPEPEGSAGPSGVVPPAAIQEPPPSAPVGGA